MALVFNDRVKETSTTTGTGTLTLDGAVQGFETFSSAIGNSNTTYYAIELPGTTEFEVGRGTVSAGQLARTQVISSSNSDSPVDFSAGTKIVFCTLPASKAVIKDASGNIPIDANKTIEFGDSGETISGDGTQLNIVSSNKVLIDAETDIHLDANGTGGAGGGDILFQDNGVTWLKSSNNTAVEILSTVSDKDLSIRGNDGGSEITALTFDMSEAGAATFNSTVTANAGLKADNITIDGTEIDLSSGDLTIDVAGQINLDADSNGLVTINDGGTQIGSFFKTASTFSIKSDVQDKRLEIKGNDGGSEVVAVAFHMANAGQANFNDKIILNANKVIEFGDSGETISGDGTAITVASSEDITLDAASEINLDAGSDSIRILDDGVQYGRIHRLSGGGLVLKSQESDKDIQFQGVDGGSGITALTLDMSNAGAATFNNSISVGDNLHLGSDSSILLFGAGNDVRLTHVHDVGLLFTNETTSAPRLQFQDAGEYIEGDGTDLTIASSNKIILNADGAGQVFFKDGGTNLAKLFVSSQVFTLETIVSDGDFAIKGNDGGSSVTALTIDMSEAGAATFNDEIILGGNKKIKFGTADENINGDGANVLNINSGGAINIAGNSANITSASTNIANFSSGGSKLFVMTNSSQSVILETDVSDKDLIFKGNDGGSVITALTLDMSEAGAAAFNSTITADGGKDVILGKNGGTNFSNSLLIGHNTTGTLSSAENNTGVGDVALDALTSGDRNTAVGRAAGSNISSSSDQTVIGNSAGANLSTGDGGNVAIGSDSIFYNTIGVRNVAVGTSALQGASGQSPDYSVGIGYQSLLNITTGDYNLALGTQAGKNITSGKGNVIIGTVDAASATGDRQLKISGYDGSSTTNWISGDSSGNITVSGTVTANGEVLSAGVSAGFAVAMAIAL